MSSKSPIEADEEVSEIATPGGEYEVFLSFRGPDTRSNITDHLYHRLIDAGIRTYRDDEEIRKGEEIGPELLRGIRESKIAIPIFSKRYAESKWCLKELAQIVERKRSNGLKVMPIFYDVSPYEVRHQTGDYAETFESHKRYHDEETVKSWKAALTEVGKLSGWDIHSDASRFFKKEGKVVKEVNRVVLHELKKKYLVEANCLVGVEHHVEKILSMSFADTNAVQFIGIHGMGGIGKTTLAKDIYNRLLPNFESHSFLTNIGETSRSKGMMSLYKELISDILGKESANVSKDDEAISVIRTRFSSKKVVILLDDVDDIFQLKDLIGKRDFFGHGSRIIVTTRNRRILDSFKVDWCYELGGLDTHLALRLFREHAFGEKNPPKKYFVLSQKAVRIAAGLPLALEVFGSYLCGMSSEVWESTLNKLEVVPHQQIRRKLSVAYEALDMQQKNIFLDIACFFIGEDYRTVIHFWGDFQHPKEAMEVLQQMSLIKIQKDHKLWMHDQLRDLGREIIREEHGEKCSVLWNEKEATKLLMRNEVDENIRGICLDMRQQSNHHFKSDKFANLPNLRFLRVEFDSFFVEAKNSKSILKDCLGRGHPFIFSELRWLSLHRFWRMRFTRSITFRKLAILDLSYSDIKSSWKGWSHIKTAKDLKVLNLTGCKLLVKTPDLSCHPLLEQLILEDCEGLVEIDKSISKLKHLVIINLRCCYRLWKLPKELSCMESLEEVHISFTSIVEIPSWPFMRRLRVFDFSSCRYLKKVSSLDFAVNITELSFPKSSITELPGSIGKLVNLLELSLKECKGIKTLPKSIGDLVSLVVLNLEKSGIEELPNTIGNLRNLKRLVINSTPLRRLPTEIGMMENLVRIIAWNCSELHDIPKLPESLIMLEVSGARTSRIPDLSNLINLKKLQLFLFDKPADLLEAGYSVPWRIGRVINLETLMLRSKRIISLPEDLGMLSHLWTLELFSCTELRSVSKLPLGLTRLKIVDCTSLRTLMDLPSSLTSLRIEDCSSLETLSNLSHLKKLSSLEIKNTPIKTLTGLHSHELQKLSLSRCEFLEIDGLDMLENLDSLFIDNCVNLQSLPDLSSLKRLKDIYVRSCPNLVEIPGIDMLENLGKLSITDCAKLQSLPDLSSLKKLKDLKV